MLNYFQLIEISLCFPGRVSAPQAVNVSWHSLCNVPMLEGNPRPSASRDNSLVKHNAVANMGTGQAPAKVYCQMMTLSRISVNKCRNMFSFFLSMLLYGIPTFIENSDLLLSRYKKKKERNCMTLFQQTLVCLWGARNFFAPQSVSGWERERLTMSQADKKWLHSLSLAAVHCVHVHCTRRTPVHSHFPLDLFTGQGPGPVLCPPLPGMTSHCNQGQTSLKYFLQSNPHKYLVHNQNLLLGWWMVLTC